MVLERESHILFDGQRVVKRSVLKQEAHLLPDLAHVVESQARDVLAVNENRSRVWLLQADDEPQQDALAGAAAPEDCQGFAALHAQADSVQNFLRAKRLMQVFDSYYCRAAVFLGCRLRGRDWIRNLLDRVHGCLARCDVLRLCNRWWRNNV